MKNPNTIQIVGPLEQAISISNKKNAVYIGCLIKGTCAHLLYLFSCLPGKLWESVCVGRGTLRKSDWHFKVIKFVSSGARNYNIHFCSLQKSYSFVAQFILLWWLCKFAFVFNCCSRFGTNYFCNSLAGSECASTVIIHSLGFISRNLCRNTVSVHSSKSKFKCLRPILHFYSEIINYKCCSRYGMYKVCITSDKNSNIKIKYKRIYQKN